jgi:hypothetical protein
MMSHFVPKVGDRLQSKSTLRTSKVIEVNEYWGWYRVRHEDDDSIKEYRITTSGTQAMYKIATEKEFLDFLLKHQV